MGFQQGFNWVSIDLLIGFVIGFQQGFNGVSIEFVIGVLIGFQWGCNRGFNRVLMGFNGVVIGVSIGF